MKRFVIKPTLYFGENALASLMNITGHHALIVTDKMMVQFGFLDKVTALLTQKNITFRQYDEVTSDPDLSVVVRGMKFMDHCYPDIVIALGGGSVIDSAKAIMYSLWCFNNKNGVHHPKPHFIAIPTTSGTGSEVTAYSVIKTGTEKHVIFDEWMLPDAAILDPVFVTSIPPHITADTGMDVLCHALEAYVSTKANDFTDALAEKAVQLVFSHLIECYQEGNHHQAREKMHNASCIAGMSFTNAALGITHSMAHALGSIFNFAHGRANALLLEPVIAFNSDFTGACNNQAAQKYGQLAKILGLPCHTPREGVHSLMTAIQVLKAEMAIPHSIKQSGVMEYDFENALESLSYQALYDSCTSTNPKNVCVQDLKNIYRNAFIGLI